ncbi:hypothetical protein C8R46DRAFT_1086061 [Mycena filopes]|nr:hypothetical protein C8R46DRAFT_1086061 [Mycena filopes]
MTSLIIKLPGNAPTSEVPRPSSVTSLKRARPDGSEDDGFESPESRPSARASGSRPKLKQPPKKKKKVVLSDPESEESAFTNEESEVEPPVDDDDEEYMSEPKNAGKRGGPKGKGGTKGKKKAEPVSARDERKRPADVGDNAGGSAAKRPRARTGQHTSGDVLVDVVGDAPPTTVVGTAPPLKEDPAPAPPKKKLPPIKKNKAAGASISAATGTATSSTPAKVAAPLVADPEESKLPPPIVGAGAARKATVPLSADVDLSNPMMYAQLFKSGGGNTPSKLRGHEKDEERRKELNRMRDEARAKRMEEAPPPFDLQAQMDKISRFEERLRISQSHAVYPNFLAGGLKAKVQPVTPKEHRTTQAEPEKKRTYEGEM